MNSLEKTQIGWNYPMSWDFTLQSQNRGLKEKWHLMKICSYLSYTSELIDWYFTHAYVCLYLYETEKCLERCVQNCRSLYLRNGAREAESEGLRLYTHTLLGHFPMFILTHKSGNICKIVFKNSTSQLLYSLALWPWIDYLTTLGFPVCIMEITIVSNLRVWYED